MSGSVSGSRTSSLEATVNGPGTLTFWWSNPSLFNSLSFEVGSNRLASLTAYPSWQQQTIYVGAGQQTFRWTYSPGPSFDFSSRGYVDEVTYTPGETKPVITSQPTGQSQLPGLAVTYKVDAGGTPPLSYQWRFKGADLPGATTSSFTITNVQPAVLGNYSVLVTNSGGSILSPDAPLEFGELTGWGSGFFGETAIPTGASNVLAITAGDYYSAMLRADRTVTAWGRNTSGQTICPEDLTNVIAIAAGAFHCLALKADGTVISWGDNRYNQTNVPVGLTNVVAIAGGLFHSLALRADGSVVAWGGNPYNTNSETNVPPGLTNVVAVSAKGFSLALKSDGTVVSWGPAPTAPRDLTNVIGVAVGQSHGLALLANRTVVAWGDNYAGQTDVPAGLTNVAAVSTGLSHSLARLADGTVKGWGRSAYAQSLIPSSLSNITA
ncbi:MAG TPA: immunoglobulin domain-containing protein, partial [Clostridia bacterium]|nr:immunoglobulin domain-containing protein [Clostridia bacterium]